MELLCLEKVAEDEIEHGQRGGRDSCEGNGEGKIYHTFREEHTKDKCCRTESQLELSIM